VAGGRTVWHVLFAALLRERRAPGFDVHAEVALSTEPQRADLLLLRQRAPTPPGEGAVLRGLWPRLGSDSLVEFKSPTRPLRRGDLIRLLGYGAQYHAREVARLERRALSLVLIVPTLSPTLGDELARLGWRLGRGRGGYAPVEGGPYPSWLVRLDEVGASEGDAVLEPFVRATLTQLRGPARAWWVDHLHGPAVEGLMQELSELEGYDELVAALLSPQAVRNLPPSMQAHILALLSPESVAAGLTAEQLAALPAEKLAALPAEKLAASLTAEQLAALPAEQLAAGLTAEQLEALWRLCKPPGGSR
jgi:hypothetical protein